MTSGHSDGRLRIELRTASLGVTLLGLAAGTQQWQFVAVVDADERPLFRSDTFAAPYSWGGIPVGSTVVPQEEWAPGMTRALDGLEREVGRAGWVEVGRGRQPWERVYQQR